MKVSIVTLTYNHERFVAQALASILAQRVNFNYEIIVADDCSSDGTRGIIEEYRNRFPDKVKPWLREHNLGMMKNFQETLKVCQGQYVAILEGDDYWLTVDKLQKQVNFLDNNPDHAMCCTRAKFVEEVGAGRSFVAPVIAPGSYTISDLIEDNFVVTPTVMYRWGPLHHLPDWVLALKMADWPLHILIARFGKIRLLDEPMSVYRIHPGGVWSSLSHEDQSLAVVEMLMAVNVHLGFECEDTIRNAIVKRFLDLAMTARERGSRSQTARYLWKYMCIGGWRFPLNRLVMGLAGYSLIGSHYKLFRPK